MAARLVWGSWLSGGSGTVHGRGVIWDASELVDRAVIERKIN